MPLILQAGGKNPYTCLLHAVISTLTFRALRSTIGKNVSFIVRILTDHMLSGNVKAEKCTGISQRLVNANSRFSGWHSTVRKTSLVFSYGMNCITVAKTVHINHIRNCETENLNGILNVKDKGSQEQLLNDTYGTICRLYVSPPHPTPLTHIPS
jgi:hypothetical protein